MKIFTRDNVTLIQRNGDVYLIRHNDSHPFAHNVQFGEKSGYLKKRIRFVIFGWEITIIKWEK